MPFSEKFTEISQSIHHIQSISVSLSCGANFSDVYWYIYFIYYYEVCACGLVCFDDMEYSFITVLLLPGMFFFMFHVWLKLFWARNMHFSFILIS